jgi:hypothetical protein
MLLPPPAVALDGPPLTASFGDARQLWLSQERLPAGLGA